MKIFAAVALILICAVARAQPPDTLDIKRTLQLKSPLGNSAIPGKLRIFEAADSGSRYVEIRAPISMTANMPLVWPISPPSPGNVLTAIANDSLGWSTPSGTGDITAVNAGTGLSGGGIEGDVTLNVIYAATAGNADTLTLHDFISGAPSTDDVIKWNGAQWIPSATAGGIDSTEWPATDYQVSLRQSKGDTATYDASKTWVLDQSYLIASDVAGKQDDSDTTAFDASKAWVTAKNYLTSSDIAAKQDDADTTSFDASKTWVTGKNYLVASDIATKQDDSDTTSFDATKTYAINLIATKQDDADTNSFDATKTYVNAQGFLKAADIATKQDDADTNTFDATKTWVNARGFLTSETGDISEVVAGGGLSGGGNSGSVTLDLNPKLSGQTIAITADSVHVKAASLDSSHIKNASIAGSDIASGTITGGKVVTNALGPTQIDETASYFFSNVGNAMRALALRPDTLALRGAATITSVNDTIIFRKANGALAFKVYTGASPTTDQILKANGNKVLVFAADATGGGGGGGNFRIRDDGSALSSSPESIDFRAGLQGIAAGTDSIEIFVLANKGIKTSTDSLGILRTAHLSGLAFKSDSVLVDTASVVIQTKTEVASQVTVATATKQDDSDTTSFDASKTWVNAQSFLKASDSTGTVLQTKTEIAAQISAATAAKQDDADTTSFDATKTWVLDKSYLVSGDIANKQDDSDTTSFDATKAYVNGRGFIKPSDSTATYLQTKTENNALYQAKSDTATYDASKTWVLNKSYLVAGDIATKQDDADTATFDASKTWVFGKNYLVAADVATKQDDSDTTGFDASKTWVKSRNLGEFGTTTSAQLLGVLNDETGSSGGSPLAVFNQNPTLAGVTVQGTAVADNFSGSGVSTKLTLVDADNDTVRLRPQTLNILSIVDGVVTLATIDSSGAGYFRSGVIAGNSALAAVGLTTKGQNAIEIDPFGSSVGNTGEIKMLELGTNGTNYLGFKSPDALAASTTYILPRKGSASTGMVLHINATADSLYWDTDDTGGGGSGNFRVRDDGSQLSASPKSIDFRAGLQGIAAGADSLEIFILANKGIKVVADSIGLLRTASGAKNLSGLAFKSDSVAVDTVSVAVQTKTEVSSQISSAIASKQDDADTTAFDASKAWVLAKNYLVAGDIAAKQDDSDTTTFDASKTWVLNKSYLVAGDITSKQDDSDTTSFDATKTWVNSKSFLTAVDSSSVTNGSLINADIRVSTLDSTRIKNSGVAANDLSDGAVLNAKLAGDAVTNAKLANMAQNTIKMRVAAGAGDPEDIDISAGLTLVTAASGDYVVIEDATDGNLKRVDAGDFLGGGVAWNAIADATGLGSIGFAGFDQDITSAEDGGDILTVTNSDAVHAATSRILVLADNDAASANAVYLQMIGDADGTPTNDYIFSQTGFTSLLAVNVPAEAYDATNWDADTGAPQKDAVRDALEGYTGRNTIVTVGTVANGTWNATAIDEAKLDLTLTTTALNASGVTTTLGTVAGAIDAGGATSLEIPNAANPSTTVEGQIAWDSNNDALEVHNGTDSRILAIRIKSIQATIVDPDVVQPITDAVSIFSVETEMFPFGITLISCGIKTNVSSTYAVNFEEWTSPTDAAPSTIEAVTTSTSTEAEDDGTLTDASIAAGSIIKVDLPTTDIGELVVWITYVINEGN